MNSNNHQNLKAGIYDPYLDTLGGGERYVLTVAETLSKNGYKVDLFWSGDPEYLTKAADRFSLDLSSVNLVPDIFKYHQHSTDLLEDQHSISVVSQTIKSDSIFHKIKSFIARNKTISKYDLFFYLSDGSLPFLSARQNFVHFQVPFIFKFTLFQKIINQLKFKYIKHIVCNSRFTSNVFQKSFSHPNEILYPPVDVEKFNYNLPKENIIISVGRFDNLLNTKKQDVLIEAFTKMYQSNPQLPWKLVLAGGSKEDPQTNQYLKHLYNLSANLPIEIMVNPDFDKLVTTYARSKIYWHAAGVGVNQELHPENTEHFGITVVEAMSSGLVPIVVNRGGLPEIVIDNKNGFLWENIDELISKTMLLIGSKQILSDLSHQAQIDSQKFSKANFSSNLLKLINQ